MKCAATITGGLQAGRPCSLNARPGWDFCGTHLRGMDDHDYDDGRHVIEHRHGGPVHRHRLGPVSFEAASFAPDRGLRETIQPIVNDWFDNGYEAGRLDTVALAERITAALEAEGSREGR